MLTKIEINKQISYYRSKSSIKKCLHPDKAKCSSKIIKAHAIQNNKYLNRLVGDVNGQSMIYVTYDFLINDNNEIVDLKAIGRNSASTFTGFCSHHDIETFKPIENLDLKLTYEHIFLHGYRAFNSSFHHFCEYYQGHLRDENQKLRFKSDIDYQNWTGKIRYKLEEIIKLKDKIDFCLKHEKYDILHSAIHLMKNQTISLASCGVLQLRHLPNNRPLSPTGSDATLLLTVLPDDKLSVAILSCFTGDITSRKFIDEFKELEKNDRENVISSLLINYTESTVLSPHLWKTIGENNRKRILKNIFKSRNPSLPREFFFDVKINLLDKNYSL
jgi:hypothetical protein